MPSEEKIVLKNTSRPQSTKPEDLFKMFCLAFDFSHDTKSIESMMLHEVTFASAEGDGVTSKNLNEKLTVPRSTIIYHLNRFMSAGFVVRKGRKYYLRSSTMAQTIEEIQFDMEREFARLIKYAEMLDKTLEGKNYDTGRSIERKIRRQKG